MQNKVIKILIKKKKIIFLSLNFFNCSIIGVNNIKINPSIEDIKNLG